MALYLISCVGVENDLPYLEHFLRHYERLGVVSKDVRLILQTTDPDSPRLDEARDILGRYGITPARLWHDPYSSRAMWEERRRLQQEIAGPGDWVVSADVDELHEYPASLEEIVAWCEREGYDIVQGPFIDRLPADGRLIEVPAPDERTLAEAYPVQTELRHHIGGHTRNVNLGGSVNLMLIRGDVMPGIGGHNVLPSSASHDHALGGPLWRFRRLADPRFLFSVPFLVHHYKWTDGLLSRIRERLALEMTPAAREYNEKLLAFFDGKGVSMEALAMRDPARDAPADWKAKVAEMRRQHARMLPMLYAKAAVRKVLGR